jgi:hypothetical protein
MWLYIFICNDDDDDDDDDYAFTANKAMAPSLLRTTDNKNKIRMSWMKI